MTLTLLIVRYTKFDVVIHFCDPGLYVGSPYGSRRLKLFPRKLKGPAPRLLPQPQAPNRPTYSRAPAIQTAENGGFSCLPTCVENCHKCKALRLKIEMNRVRSACVKTNSSKTCFVSLSGDLAETIGLRIQVHYTI